jgi:hypothetical protein
LVPRLLQLLLAPLLGLLTALLKRALPTSQQHMAPPDATQPPSSGSSTPAGDPCMPRAAAAADAEHAHTHTHAAVYDSAADGVTASSEWQSTLASVSKAVVVLKARGAAAQRRSC